MHPQCLCSTLNVSSLRSYTADEFDILFWVKWVKPSSPSLEGQAWGTNSDLHLQCHFQSYTHAFLVPKKIRNMHPWFTTLTQPTVFEILQKNGICIYARPVCEERYPKIATKLGENEGVISHVKWIAENRKYFGIFVSKPKMFDFWTLYKKSGSFRW